MTARADQKVKEAQFATFTLTTEATLTPKHIELEATKPMLLDQRDFDLLRLIALCKDIPVDCSPLRCDMFSDAEFSALTGTGYIRKSKSGLSYRLTDQGYALLTANSVPAERDKYPVGNSGTLRRRLESAKVVLSAYRAGIEVFEESSKTKTVFIPAFTLRRKSKGAILGSSRLCGFIYYPDFTLFVYFISANTVLNRDIEAPVIHRIMALRQDVDMLAFHFLGDEPSELECFVSPFKCTDVRSAWGDSFTLKNGGTLYAPPATPLEGSIYA